MNLLQKQQRSKVVVVMEFPLANLPEGGEDKEGGVLLEHKGS